MRILNTTGKGYGMGRIIDWDVSMGKNWPKLTIPVVRFDAVPIWAVDEGARWWVRRRGLIVAEDTKIPLQVCHVLVLKEVFAAIDFEF
jgi:hypothetical protein